MKTINIILASAAIISLFSTSCELMNVNKGDPEFRMEFSDGTKLTERDIMYYDSSTHFLYLKEDLDFNGSVSGFDILVNNDTIYDGLIHSCVLSYFPETAFYITDCFHYGRNIITLGYHRSSTDSRDDLRNDRRIIDALKNNHLLRSGLKCTIDSIRINTHDDYSESICKVTITNSDMVDYYILDPQKMGELDFNYYTGGITFQNIDTKVSYPLRWSVPNPDYGYITMDDFSVLPGNSKVTYIFKSSDYYKMEKGFYKAFFRFCGLKYNAGKFDLSRDKERIWIGEAISEIDSISVN